MPSFAITSIGVDRTGIVAAVTRVLLESGCNVEDTAMSILRGQFAMVMVVAAPEGSDAAELERRIVEGTEGFDLLTSVRELHDASPTETTQGARWTVVVYGPDHPGIVHVVAERLAQIGVNIVDVTTRVTGRDGALYSMVMEIVLPDDVDGTTLEEHLATVADEESLTVRAAPADADVL